MSFSIKSLTTEELQAELEFRKKIGTAMPVERNPINWDPLLEMIRDETKYLAEKRHLVDFEHYVYETAMTCVYGDGYWKWRNKMDE